MGACAWRAQAEPDGQRIERCSCHAVRGAGDGSPTRLGHREIARLAQTNVRQLPCWLTREPQSTTSALHPLLTFRTSALGDSAPYAATTPRIEGRVLEALPTLVVTIPPTALLVAVAVVGCGFDPSHDIRQPVPFPAARLAGLNTM